MFIVLLTRKFVQIMYFVIKTDNTFIIFTFFEKYWKCKNENNLEIVDSKYFMFGKYSSLDTNQGEGLLHACISSYSIIPTSYNVRRRKSGTKTGAWENETIASEIRTKRTRD